MDKIFHQGISTVETYLVGGAVRDKLLNLPVKEKDWVVVGSTPDEMIELGYKPVGKDFPVFLHPETHDEYALARTERKTAKGYKGFVVHADKDVTLQEDLQRRDLTINAIAEDKNGNLIDPYHGQDDLKNKILRHVSDAFVEDPVRVLRIARFAAKFGNFIIAPETLILMKQIVQSGEVDALVPERVWQELNRALQEQFPWRFFDILRECGALKVIFPEIDALFGVPNPKKWHPEVDSGIHTMLVLKEITKLSKNPIARFAALLHDIGKTKTPKEEWPRHFKHCELGVGVIKPLCKRLRAPHQYQDLAVLVACYHMDCHKVFEFKPKTLLELLEALDPFRKPERFKLFLLVCKADARGRIGGENDPYKEADFLQDLYQECAKINIQPFIDKYDGKAIAEAIHAARLKVIKSFAKE